MLAVTQPQRQAIYNQTKVFYCDPIKLVTYLILCFRLPIMEIYLKVRCTIFGFSDTFKQII